MKKRKNKHPLSLMNPAPVITKYDGARIYAQLRQTVAEKGILRRAYGYYLFIILTNTTGFFISSYNLFIQQSPIALLFWAIIFSFFSVQLAGLMHDAGHRGIFKSVGMNDTAGYIFAALIAGGFSAWKIKHNMHHAHPNEEGEDPDVELPLLSFTKERFYAKKGFAKLLRRYQAYLYYPLGIFVIFSVRSTAARYFKSQFAIAKIPELTVFLIGIFIWFIVPFLLFPLTKAVVLLIIVNAATGIYLLNVFAPNHKGMPQLRHGVKISFLEQQIMTSRNIYGNLLTDYIYMGLNYQIEHHLFPNCPRNKLHLITPYLLEVCRRLRLEYTQVDILTSNKIILSELHEIAQLPAKRT